jgi:hypothetical protein
MRSIPAFAFVVSIALIAFSPDHAHAALLSTSKQFAEPKPDMALVYLVREKRFQGSARTMFVYADQTFLAALDNDSYAFAYLPPGKHLLWLNWAKINVEVELEAGKTYYYAIWMTFDELDETSGEAFVDGVAAYATPEPNEIEKSADHISERYGKALAAAAERPDEEPAPATNPSARAANVAEWPKVDLSAYSVLCVEPFVMADPKADDREPQYLVETAPARIADLVLENLGESVFSEVRREPGCAAPEAVALRARVAQYKPGNETARFMMAGAGNAQIELVVTLLDVARGQQLAEFEAKGTWAWGGGMGLARGIPDLEKNVAFEVASYLTLMRGVVPATEP